MNFRKSSNIPALHFLLGDLPIEAKIHQDVFSLFFSVWRNPDSKIHSILKYLLETSESNSRTWSIHIKYLAEKYGHPALYHLITTHEVQKSRIHLKMLAGDYLTYEVKSNQSGGSPHCRSCDPPSPIENMAHILSSCSAYDDIKQRMLPELESVCAQSKSNLDFSKIKQNNETLCQFLLDPTSFNLQQRIHRNDPLEEIFFKFSRDY